MTTRKPSLDVVLERLTNLQKIIQETQTISKEGFGAINGRLRTVEWEVEKLKLERETNEKILAAKWSDAAIADLIEDKVREKIRDREPQVGSYWWSKQILVPILVALLGTIGVIWASRG